MSSAPSPAPWGVGCVHCVPSPRTSVSHAQPAALREHRRLHGSSGLKGGSMMDLARRCRHVSQAVRSALGGPVSTGPAPWPMAVCTLAKPRAPQGCSSCFSWLPVKLCVFLDVSGHWPFSPARELQPHFLCHFVLSHLFFSR